jgi:hypothetical protein
MTLACPVRSSASAADTGPQISTPSTAPILNKFRTFRSPSFLKVKESDLSGCRLSRGLVFLIRPASDNLERIIRQWLL